MITRRKKCNTFFPEDGHPSPLGEGPGVRAKKPEARGAIKKCLIIEHTIT
jgi:hypothetical protein